MTLYTQAEIYELVNGLPNSLVEELILWTIFQTPTTLVTRRLKVHGHNVSLSLSLYYTKLVVVVEKMTLSKTQTKKSHNILYQCPIFIKKHSYKQRNEEICLA